MENQTSSKTQKNVFTRLLRFFFTNEGTITPAMTRKLLTQEFISKTIWESLKEVDIENFIEVVDRTPEPTQRSSRP